MRYLFYIICCIFFLSLANCGPSCPEDLNAESFNSNEKYFDLNKTHYFTISDKNTEVKFTQEQIDIILKAFNTYDRYFPNLFEYNEDPESKSIVVLSSKLKDPYIAMAYIMGNKENLTHFQISISPQALDNLYITVIHELGHVIGFRHYAFDNNKYWLVADATITNRYLAYLAYLAELKNEPLQVSAEFAWIPEMDGAREDGCGDGRHGGCFPYLSIRWEV